uniref:Uncharacterized protein n=1 Tax=Romanomermis culicivorax TaxID=13658 RepID=A0A915K300_ROMCU
MITVSAVAKLIPNPPARVDNRKTNCWAPVEGHITKSRIAEVAVKSSCEKSDIIDYLPPNKP